MMKRYSQLSLAGVICAGLLASFWLSPAWLQLCAGLALFLFGMQCLEEGLRQVAGSKLEEWLARSTATPVKGLLFGIVGTLTLQSSTLVSLLTIAFISAGLIQLAGGIAILFGANLGATSGIWLLALAGQNLSLAPLALPLLVLGVLASFIGPRSKAVGRFVLGVAFIFLGIDEIKAGFGAFGDAMDLTSQHTPGWSSSLLFVAAGLLLTLILQSSHAALMLTLAALASGQLELGQGLAIAIGSNIGSSVSTAFVGALGGNRGGQRLALAHVLFNLVTGVLAFLLLQPLGWLVHAMAAPVGLGDNALIQLALFHTLFNGIGVLLFWPWQTQLADTLIRWLPDKPEPEVLIPEAPHQLHERVHARYLNPTALNSADAAAAAVVQELGHLGRLSMEVICHALYLPAEQLSHVYADESLLEAPPQQQYQLDADALYQRHVKGVYGDLLTFMGRMEQPMDHAHQQFWTTAQLTALQLVDAVKDAKHLQKNLSQYLNHPPSPARAAYVDLRRHLLGMLHDIRELSHSDLVDDAWCARLNELETRSASFEEQFRQRLFGIVRSGQLDGLQTSSLMNDLGYASRLLRSMRNVLVLGKNQTLLRQLEQDGASEETRNGLRVELF